MPLLPDEIVHEILKPVLGVPDEVFCDTGPSAFEFRAQISTSAFLLVCKQWLRVATPLLFEVVILRSSGQAKALARVLRANKQFGQFIRMLRVEGGFGMAMQTIISAAPKVRDLYLTFSQSSSDNVQGLCNALPSINPCRLFIHESVESLQGGKHVLDNAKTRDLTDAVCRCIRMNWTNLRVCQIPYVEHAPWATTQRASSLSVALKHSPNLESLVLSRLPTYAHNLTSDALEGFASNPGLKAVRLLASYEEAGREGFVRQLNRMPRVAKLIVYEELPSQEDQRESDVKDKSSIAYSYVCLSSSSQAVRAKVWSRILEFVMDVNDGECHIERVLRKDEGIKINGGRLQFLLVCKELYELALPFLYRFCVVANFTGLRSLSDKLVAQPALGSNIRFLMLNQGITGDLAIFGSEEVEDYGQLRDHVNVFLKRIFSKTPHLQQVLTYHFSFFDSERFRIDWSVWDTICSVAGASVKTMHGFRIEDRIEDDSEDQGGKSLSIFNGLTVIRSLEWSSRTAFRRDDDVSPTSLSSLEMLTLHKYDDSFLSELSRMSLPSLQTAVIDQISFVKTSESLLPFLTKHGLKLRRLELLSVFLKLPSLFNLCPNLTEFTLETDSLRGIFLVDDILAHIHSGECSQLKKIIIRDPNAGNWPYDTLVATGTGAPHVMKTWSPFFDGLDLSELPALEAIQITLNLWPTNQRAYAKNPWIKWDAELKRRWNVGLLDEAGKGWTPRLK
ncbi:hypothetical protein GLOTRDRAFT_141424 [Gloeophyllum trabeum ATCC 11539]|uniref:Uncharacterized protein n=1 Tax=Gloeophyllum trabeum (strain ATCC 11539 / FP-39264 / Madison 617) TaxID=670483 RepID=S7PS46_GLOTA|nr:uncharacterized protein GLOTRDRAFT_141424 [Gloeophyllum trabeum ATCC 11539]EPQ50626.1 hypothetical protein GLOTRDRAFT_141424 [Gloeophyllum trabeum ATCC 11539]